MLNLIYKYSKNYVHLAFAIYSYAVLLFKLTNLKSDLTPKKFQAKFKKFKK